MNKLLNTVIDYLRPMFLAILFMAIAGFFNACMDTIAHHYDTSIFVDKNELFYNPAKSWANKWTIDSDGSITLEERFFLSSTLLVWVTDFWHLSKTMMITFIILSILVYQAKREKLVMYLIDFVLLRGSFVLIFHLCYTYLLMK